MVEAARVIAPAAIHIPPLKRLRPWIFSGLFLLVFLAACADLDLTFEVLSSGFGKLGFILGSMWPPSDGGQFGRLMFAIAQTLAMAVLGTLLGAVVALPLALVAARNIVANPLVHFLVRRSMDLFRGIPALVWALILVAAFGLGPIPGILALAFSDIPRLAKLFAEAMENVDERQRESLRATGADVAGVLRFGTLPQVLPIWLSQCLYFLEQNFRAAAVVGIVGAGGIGFELQERIRIFAFDEVAYITLIYILAVAIFDHISDRLRARLV
ncbi:MAG: phosphonate ABC transporter, permease protein PhnE [Sphingomonadaceae bacterium]